MNYRYFNLNVGWNREYEDNLNLLSKLGWDGVCFTENYSKKFSRFAEKIKQLKESSELEIYSGAIVSKPVRRNARNALDKADIIFVVGENREASECWEIDVISRPEQSAERDFMKQRDSGIDHIISRFMAEKSIALELNFSDILHSGGRGRATLIGRMRQNILLARKYRIPLITTTGSNDIFDLRGPLEHISMGKVLGLTLEGAVNTVSLNPMKVIQKSADRKNPDILLKGLEVTDWGETEKPARKRMYGWY